VEEGGKWDVNLPFKSKSKERICKGNLTDKRKDERTQVVVV
jgi:hypothetical protein